MEQITVNLQDPIILALVEKAKSEGRRVLLQELFDKDGVTSYGEVLTATPGYITINEFEKSVDRDPLKAKLILIKGTFLTRADEANEKVSNTGKFSAMFAAAMEQLPKGKAIVKNEL